jgi:hypothetical protein
LCDKASHQGKYQNAEAYVEQFEFYQQALAAITLRRSLWNYDGIPMKKVSAGRRVLLAAIVLLFYALHQDVWFWRTARPFVFDFLPIGIAYHAGYSVGAALLMFLLVKLAWPAHLDSSDSVEGRH